MDPIEAQYRLIAARDADATIKLLTMVQDRAADIRNYPEWSQEVRMGSVAILSDMIDRLRASRNALMQRSGGGSNADD